MAITHNRSGKIYWREAGAGAPLLLIMGIGYTSDMWRHIEPLLAAAYRLILFDNRGTGQSSDAEADVTIADMADDAISVLDAAQISSTNVFGMSMGGYIAQELTLRHPDRVRALILGCTSCGGERAVSADNEVRKAIEARRSMSPEQGVRALNRYIYDPSTPEERIESDMNIRLRTYPSSLNYDRQLAAIQAWQAWNRLGDINTPTLVLHGTNDRLIPPENGRILAAAIAGAEFREIENASHIFTTDQPARTADIVHEFLASQH